MINFSHLVAALAAISSMTAPAQVNYQHTTTLSSDDYLLGSHGKRSDPVFDNFRTVDLGIDLGIGADCGRIDFRGTMRAALDNILNSKYLEDMGRDIMAASPMLLTCYYSPTWCSILKQGQLRASMLANMRLDQCSTIDRYVDSRVEDYQQERQQCVRKEIANSEGNFEQAMQTCGGNYWQADISSWSGDEGSGKTAENELLGSSAKWAGFTGKEAERTVSLVKALVGDTVVERGMVSVNFGPGQKPLTPRTHLMSLEKQTYSELCGRLLPRVEQNGGRGANLDQVVTDADLKLLSGESENSLIDRQTIRSLTYLPPKQRSLACRKLADAISMTVFAMDMNKSLDFLSSPVASNPHLPDHRKQEAERKRLALKDQIEMTLTLNKNKSEPLNQVLYQINDDGARFQDAAAERTLRLDEASHQTARTNDALFDCADGILCAH
ncbi:MAG: hypothetical protein AB7T49_06645 [Oligoflexales bacterium]